MSDDGSSTNSGGSSDIILYQCRHCPGVVLTEAEKDVHRQQHRRRRDMSVGRGHRDGSPAASAASFTIVQPTNRRRSQDPAASTPTTRGSKQKKDADQESKAESPKKGRLKAGREKIKSRKTFNKKQPTRRFSTG